MLEFSDESKRLVSTFLTYRNDVDIYTEDEIKDKEFYKVLLNRLVENRIKINDITPLGSKQNVIERCKNEPENGRKKLFIIDRDIAIIHGANIPELKNLFVLDAYCIENFLLDEDSVIHFIYLNCCIKSKEEIVDELSYKDWLNQYSSSLINLFIHFALVDFYGGKFALYSANKFFERKNDEMIFSNILVQEEINRLKAQILERTPLDAYQTKLEELKSKWQETTETLTTIVSAKDYLIPILLFKTQTFKKSKALPSKDEAKFSLVQYCSLNRLESLKQVLVNI